MTMHYLTRELPGVREFSTHFEVSPPGGGARVRIPLHRADAVELIARGVVKAPAKRRSSRARGTVSTANFVDLANMTAKCVDAIERRLRKIEGEASNEPSVVPGRSTNSSNPRSVADARVKAEIGLEVARRALAQHYGR